MPIDPVKIPQNVYIEDRVVGPLSLRQIIIMALGGGFSYMLYASWDKANGSVSLPVAVLLWMPAVIAAAFALVKINDLSLMRICFLLLEKANKPKTRLWTPRTGISINIRTTPKKEDPKAKTEAKKTDTRKEIASLSSVVDRGIPTVIEGKEGIEDKEGKDDAGIAERTSLSSAVLPVNPQRVTADSPASISLPPMSDMSVFRDVLPPTA